MTGIGCGYCRVGQIRDESLFTEKLDKCLIEDKMKGSSSFLKKSKKCGILSKKVALNLKGISSNP